MLAHIKVSITDPEINQKSTHLIAFTYSTFVGTDFNPLFIILSSHSSFRQCTLVLNDENKSPLTTRSHQCLSIG